MDLLLLSIVILVFIILFIDIFPILKNWTLRIHIGRYNNYDEWENAITERGIKWLSKTPKIKLKDQSRLILLDIIRGNYSKDAIQHWQQAALLLGLTENYKLTDNNKIYVEIVRFLDMNFDKDGNWIKKPEYVDAAILSYSVMNLENVDLDKYKPGFDQIWEMINSHIGEDGTVKYRIFMSNYRYVDTIGFICPFLIKYGTKFNKNECIDLAINQIKKFNEYGMVDSFKLPFHVYKINDDKAPIGMMGWGRGLGWYAIGLIDAWGELSAGSENKPILEKLIIEFANKALKLQQKNGSWNWTVTRNESRADSSATATIGWFMIKASEIEIEEVSKECLESAERAISYLMQVTRKNGSVDFSQGDTKDIGVYSSSFDILPFTQGFCMRLISYYNKKKKHEYEAEKRFLQLKK
ncbi:glycoside hydrolase family 88 protein [Bacillus sp. UMB0893]|uniref:glycoside hydrolase family 88 protein n=1 Tax=Bacillus sp. UMB0893 TaxID=2066053 RepID=UPI000C78CE62|nr:glycoside hydrolase family 88 protein [Bacillus sp. UMB0893]PLR68732.1 hypothetical protein CYJ36_07175 [Bacillus sp. UMB0893]